jgi:hypothetical protein
MDVNRNAPVLAAGEIEVAADPEIVWAVIADIDRWPAWNPDVKSSSLGVGRGISFRSNAVLGQSSPSQQRGRGL